MVDLVAPGPVAGAGLLGQLPIRVPGDDRHVSRNPAAAGDPARGRPVTRPVRAAPARGRCLAVLRGAVAWPDRLAVPGGPGPAGRPALCAPGGLAGPDPAGMGPGLPADARRMQVDGEAVDG